VIHALESSDPERKTLWIEHLQTSLIDLKDITTVIREEDRSCYIVLHYQNGLKAPSWLLSDGTLRLLALTLLAYAPKAPALILIEEPENGIHPKAIETVMQSLQSVYDSQILCATHSPIVLSQLSTKQILCFTKQDDGAVDIIRGDKHPQLQGWKSTLNLGDLLATGVLG
jgi:predicted ATPase